MPGGARSAAAQARGFFCPGVCYIAGARLRCAAPATMIKRIAILVTLGLVLSACGRIKDRYFLTRVECCEEKAACCNGEVCCLPRYAQGHVPEVQTTVEPFALPGRAGREAEREDEEEREKPGLLGRLNPLAYLRGSQKKEGKEESATEKARKEKERSFFGKIIPF